MQDRMGHSSVVTQTSDTFGFSLSRIHMFTLKVHHIRRLRLKNDRLWVTEFSKICKAMSLKKKKSNFLYPLPLGSASAGLGCISQERDPTSPVVHLSYSSRDRASLSVVGKGVVEARKGLPGH